MRAEALDAPPDRGGRASTSASATSSSSRGRRRRAAGARSCAARSAELQRAGVPVRGARLRDQRGRAARRRAVVLGGARGRADAGADRAGGRARARPDRAGQDLLADRERLGGRADRPARPARVAARRGRPRAADRLPLARRCTPVPLELGELQAGHARLGRAALARRLGLQRAPARVRAWRPRSSACRACATRRSRRPRALPTPLDRRAEHIITENQRVDAAVAALERRDMDELGRLLDASHASLRDCYEVSTPAVESGRRAAARRAGRSERGSSAAASAATCSG